VAKNNLVGRNFTQRLLERRDWKCRHKTVSPVGDVLPPCTKSAPYAPNGGVEKNNQGGTG
jgi:hypothetical protein